MKSEGFDDVYIYIYIDETKKLVNNCGVQQKQISLKDFD
jgi:hypothetical protein